MRERMRRWWRARQRRRAWSRLEQSLDDKSADDHTAAALLALLTERIAHLDRGSASDVAAVIDVATRVRDDYRAYQRRLAPLRETAESELANWQRKVALVEELDAKDLLEPARERRAMWEERLREAEAACEDCALAERRINDALAELIGLAGRLER